MKLAWFTPFNEESGIGQYSLRAISILSQYHNITVFTDDNSKKNIIHSSFNVEFINEDTVNKLQLYDFALYNFGDNARYHSEIYKVFLQYPGICILHDYSLLNFFIGYYGQQKVFKYIENIYELEKNIHSIDLYDLYKYPLTELFEYNSYGYITHGLFVKEYLETFSHAPITVLNSPYFLSANTKEKHEIKKNIDDKIHILTIGYVNLNKRIDKTLYAFANSQYLKKNAVFDIVGGYDKDADYFQKLIAIVKENNLDNCVHFHGYQDNKSLIKFLKNSDICVNLRFPSLSSASWSIIEQFEYKKPVIISDSEVFKDIDSSVVIKVPVGESEIHILQEKLEQLVKSDDQRKILGDRGYEFAIKYFSDTQYKEKFNKFLDETQKNKFKKQFLINVEKNIKNISYNTKLNFYNKLVNKMSNVLNGEFY